jgi:hypothetical protein
MSGTCYVSIYSSTLHLLQYLRSEVSNSVGGVPREHKHRVDDEDGAYYGFKAMLDAGKVTIVNSE